MSVTMAADQDRVAPIERDEISNIINHPESATKKVELIERILGYLNEKRDAYNGLISSIIYIIDTNDDDLILLLEAGLERFIATQPMRYGGKAFVTRCQARLIKERPKFIANFFTRLILDPHTCWETTINDPRTILSIKITALRGISLAEQSKREKLSDIKVQQVDTICDQAVIHGDNYTKLDTLYLILESKVLTRVLSDRELGIYFTIFKEALELQVPDLRQKFLAITGKLFKRMKNSIRVVHRDQDNFSDDERLKITCRYNKFLDRLLEFCLGNIYPNKYFGSLTVILTTLNHVLEHINLDDPHLRVAQFFQTKRFRDSVLSCLVLDTFDDNKKLALSLLMAIGQNGLAMRGPELDSLESIAYQLVKSINPAHSLSCQYIFKLIISYEESRSNADKNSVLYKHLDKLVSFVERGVKEAKVNLLLALKQTAIHPKLSCIRSLLSVIDVKQLGNNRASWITLVERIVRASIEACRSVASLVCNMNPETIGHLPMDQEPIDIETLAKNLDQSVNLSDAHISTITSQYLLITGWKTIKECSLTFGALCSHLWWPENTKMGKPILQSDSIESIIEFFEHYLRNLRHRGAFEQAYAGFVIVTKRVWNDEKFRNLLVTLLNNILDDFKQHQSVMSENKVKYLKKHVTRRSAGLPFLVQAIAISEARHESKILRFIMETLISVMESRDSGSFQKIHCLNILKAITNDSNLAEKVIPYLGEIFIITIEAFKSDDFPIRNCANMLMRALVDRIFGVSRARGEIHRRNTMSYEKFFTEYPKLKEYLRESLEDGLKSRKSFVSVHAAYIILSHLRPNIKANVDFAIEKTLGPYTVPVRQLALTCADFKLRDLSAKIFVQLEVQIRDELSYDQFSLFEEYSRMIKSEDLSKRATVDANSLHGLLSMLKYWMERFKSISCPKYQTRLLLLVDEALESIQQIEAHDETHFLRISAIDLCETCCLVNQVSDLMLNMDWIPPELFEYLEGRRPLFEPMPTFEHLVFRSVSLTTTLLNFTHNLSKSLDTLKTIITIVKRPSDRVLSVNLKAAFVRLLGQFLTQEADFVDNLKSEFDLDSTAAHMTPIDRLNQRPELDSERELWLNYCQQKELRSLIRDEIPVDQLNQLVALFEFEEFQLSQSNNMMVINSPFAVELLAFVCKSWKHYDLEKRCIWLDEDETLGEKLRYLIKFIKNLPDCDVKCLWLLCASHLFRSHLIKIQQAQAVSAGFKPLSQEHGLLLDNVKEFSLVVEELSDGHHSSNIRKTCSEILFNTRDLLSTYKCRPLKESLMNMFSTLIKLCQDEDYAIREKISRTIAHFNSVDSARSSGSDLDELILFVTRNLLETSDREDVMRCFELLSRIIFDHSRNSSIDLDEERASLFDKTRQNVFADHVKTIQNTLVAAEEFFAESQHSIKLNSVTLSVDILNELIDVDDQSEHDIGDYSWRQKGDSKIRLNKCEKDCAIVLNRSLETLKRSLSYFNYSNMLTDTSFGSYELKLFRKLALIRLIFTCTDYNDTKVLEDIKRQLAFIIATRCATTMMSKCYELTIQS